MQLKPCYNSWTLQSQKRGSPFKNLVVQKVSKRYAVQQKK
ncbi:MAG: hypothetical protein ACI8ZX_001341 [Planctomycetota bacterium]|jgi:hypothetical protein